MSDYDTRHDHRAEHYRCAECGAALAEDDPVGRYRPLDDMLTVCTECIELSAREAAAEKAISVASLYLYMKERGSLRGYTPEELAEKEAKYEQEKTTDGFIELHGLCDVEKCKGCSRQIHALHHLGVRLKAVGWCSEHCRMRHYKGGPREQQRCRHCDEWFTPKSRKAKFCSPRCRGMNYRSRHPDYGTMEE